MQPSQEGALGEEKSESGEAFREKRWVPLRTDFIYKVFAELTPSHAQAISLPAQLVQPPCPQPALSEEQPGSHRAEFCSLPDAASNSFTVPLLWGQ